MQDLSSLTRDHTHAPTMEAWIPNHRTARVSPNITWFFCYIWPVASQGWSLWRGISLCGMPLGCLLECMQTTDRGFHNDQFKVTKVCHPSGEGSEEQQPFHPWNLKSYRSLWRAIIFWVASRCTGRFKRQRWWQLRATQPRVLPLWVLSYYHACGITWTVINMYIRIE